MTSGPDGGAAAGRPGGQRPSEGPRLAGQAAARPRFTSRAAVLVIVMCAIGLSLAYPIREYIAERRQIDQLELQNSQLAGKVANLRARERAVTSPAFIEREARDRLHMCFPSQTCYVVIPPANPHGKAVRGSSQPATPWYGALWASVRKADRTAAKPPR